MDRKQDTFRPSGKASMHPLCAYLPIFPEAEPDFWGSHQVTEVLPIANFERR
jgi:hypothetical protein